jgi:hypothetical protein
MADRDALADPSMRMALQTLMEHDLARIWRVNQPTGTS